MKNGQIVRRTLVVEIPVKRRRRRPNLRWKDACKRDMTEAGPKRTTQQTGENEGGVIGYTGDPRWRDKLGRRTQAK